MNFFFFFYLKSKFVETKQTELCMQNAFFFFYLPFGPVKGNLKIK